MAKKRLKTAAKKSPATPGRKPLSRMDLLTGRNTGGAVVRDSRKPYKAPKESADAHADKIGKPTAGTFRRPSR